MGGIPTDFIIDREGILRHIIVGYAPRRLAAEVRQLLPAPCAKEHAIGDRTPSVLHASAVGPKPYSYRVRGMECPLCGPSLRSELLKLPGVKAAMVSYAHGTACIQAKSPPFRPGTVLRINFHRGAIRHNFVLEPVAGQPAHDAKAGARSAESRPRPRSAGPPISNMTKGDSAGGNSCCQ